MISKKMRKKLSHRGFKINIFEINIFVITSKKLFQSVLDDIKYDANTNNVAGLCLSTLNGSKNKDIFIGIFCDKDDVLVHECTHASLYILNDIEEIASEQSELQPYLIQTIYRECKNLL